MKKLIAIASAATLGFGLAACGDGRDDALQDDTMMADDPAMTGTEMDPPPPAMADEPFDTTDDTDTTTTDPMVEADPGQM